jgi:hypothetical protein
MTNTHSACQRRNEARNSENASPRESTVWRWTRHRSIMSGIKNTALHLAPQARNQM